MIPGQHDGTAFVHLVKPSRIFIHLNRVAEWNAPSGGARQGSVRSALHAVREAKLVHQLSQTPDDD
eukprot:5254362-Alexandrium_andersonii.AAC.1